MKLMFWRYVMHLSWTLATRAEDFVEWAQQKYSNELHGMGTIE